MTSVDEWVPGATGCYLLTCEPLAGTTSFFADVAELRVGDTLLVTTARSADRVPSAAHSSVASVVDATPMPTERGPSVGSPADLTGISIPVSEFLRRADAPAVTLDSGSPLLYHGEEAAVFRFLSVLTAHIASSDGFGIFAMSPAAHRRETVDTCAEVFDGRIELDGDGERPGNRVLIDADDAPDGWQAL